MCPGSLLCLSIAVSSPGADCNGNGLPDERDIAGGLRLSLARLSPPHEVFGEWALGARGIVLADFDGDGDLDAMGTDGLVSAFLALNDGDGTLAAGGVDTVHAGAMPFDDEDFGDRLAAGDLDGDGHPDAVIPGGSDPASTLSLLQGGGLPFFSIRELRLDQSVAAVALGDLDGDGDLDILGAGSQEHAAILRNAGLAEFITVELYPAGKDSDCVTLADLDRDGDLDAAVGGRRRDDLSLLFNRGDGSFDPGLEIPVAASAMAAADLDGKGFLDLAVAGTRSESGFTVLHDLARDGSAVVETHAEAGHASSLSLADLDGDGRLDAALATPDGLSATVFRNAGATFELAGAFAAGGIPNAVAAGDLDGDADADLVLGLTAASPVSTLIHAGGGSLRAAKAHPLRPTELRETGLALADLDGDGDADAAASGGGGHTVESLEILENAGQLGFTARQEIELPRSLGAAFLAVADLEGDGDLDLIGGGAGPVLSFVNDGASLSAPQRLVGVFAHGLLPADLDGDGDTDLALGRQPSRLDPPELVLFHNQAGYFTEAGRFPLGGTPAAIASGDLDGDGLRDLAIAEAFGIGLLLADGAGSFGDPVRLRAGSNPAAIAVHDLDGDADLDLATGNAVFDSQLGGNASVFLNRGGGSFADARNHGTGPPPNSIAAADLDEDGRADLLTAGFTFDPDGLKGGEVSLLRGLESGFFAPAESLDVGPHPSHLLAGDLDRDGDAELALVTDAEPQRAFIVIENLSAAPRSADADGDGVPDECQAVDFRRGDFETDGRVGLGDALAILQHLFVKGRQGACLKAGDADDTGRLDVTDAITLLLHLFQGGGPLPAPWPDCGRDATRDALPCARFDSCG